MKKTPISPPAPAPAPIPVSLGKPSLRQRLEAYYSLISPTVLSDTDEWKRKFDLIYNKYGGSVDGENALAKKLIKKYGPTVRLRLTTPSSLSKNANDGGEGSSTYSMNNEKLFKRSEDWYRPTKSQESSEDINFTSPNFDAQTALSSDISNISQVNPYIQNTKKILDNISKFQFYLPKCDPLYKEFPKTKKPSTTPTPTCTNNNNDSTIQKPKQKIPIFTSISTQYASSGPLSLLHTLHTQRQRTKVLIRYIDCIRGTLTGYILAFDKHMNMILTDVDEVYSSRRVTIVCEGMEMSQGELECCRRTCCYIDNDDDHEDGYGRHKSTSRSNSGTDDSNRMERSLLGGQLLQPPASFGRKHDGATDVDKTPTSILSSSLSSMTPITTATKPSYKQTQGDCTSQSSIFSKPGTMPRIKVKRRHFQQMFVRGDNVVMVWRDG